ncbi:energy transducer TonB [Tenacibaculum pacificus]|uniref:energy transducer TonB n=1 Tax=Tenacibaculum pacificus TaxID=3018314 RepID=UPI0038CD63C4
MITKYGKVDRVETFSSGDKSDLEDEVKRIVLLFPDFLPGKENGHNVGVVYTMPIDFKL